MTQTRSQANARRGRERVVIDGIDTENTSGEAPPAFQELIQRYNYDGNAGPPPNGHGGATSSLHDSLTRGVKRTLTEANEMAPSSSLPVATESPAKRKRESSKYAPPSKYAHLPPLVDILEPNLICVFVGTNPGIRTATAGHAYAHPSNLFWKLLHSSGCTDRRCRPEEDVDLPKLYAMGNTNIVERPTKDAGELSKAEMAAGTPILEDKIRKYRPQAVCIVGKGIWEAIWRYRHGKNPSKDEFHWGWQDETDNMGKTDSKDGDAEEDWNGAKVYVTSSTSGLSASLRPPEKEAIWKPFGEWVKARRKDRLSSQ